MFSAGDEMSELAALDAGQAAAMAADLQAALGCLSRVPQPTVAAITGYCLGAGLELALGADHRIIGDNVKLGLPQIKAGLIPLSGIRRLSLLIGASRAKDIVYTGRFVDAEEAAKIGLVDEVVAPNDVLTAARAWAAQFVTAAPRALAAPRRSSNPGRTATPPPSPNGLPCSTPTTPVSAPARSRPTVRTALPSPESSDLPIS